MALIRRKKTVPLVAQLQTKAADLEDSAVQAREQVAYHRAAASDAATEATTADKQAKAVNQAFDLLYSAGVVL